VLFIQSKRLTSPIRRTWYVFRSGTAIFCSKQWSCINPNKFLNSAMFKTKATTTKLVTVTIQFYSRFFRKLIRLIHKRKQLFNIEHSFVSVVSWLTPHGIPSWWSEVIEVLFVFSIIFTFGSTSETRSWVKFQTEWNMSSVQYYDPHQHCPFLLFYLVQIKK
jgi:hypothetical protein